MFGLSQCAQVEGPGAHGKPSAIGAGHAANPPESQLMFPLGMELAAD